MVKEFKFEDLEGADLIVDAVYKGGTAGDASDDPLSRLLGCGVQGGFHYLGSVQNLDLKLVALYSSLSDPDWPDFLDTETGQFTYFGDNKTPGSRLHETPRRGNVILRDCFEAVHGGRQREVPPFLIFTKGVQGRDVVFKGLAVPGAPGVGFTEDLVAVWKTAHGERFQNYRAIFTVLDVDTIPREWINDLMNDDPLSANCPQVWREWVEKGTIVPLKSARTVEYRSKAEQLPQGDEDMEMVRSIYEYFEGEPHRFEACAAELFRLMDANVLSYNLTPPWVDGGRDAVGKYRVGWEEDSIEVNFSLEAKHYNVDHAVGVRDTSRLISRLRNRQFGVLVTTSYVHRQAYREIREDGHPIIVISARDIVKILKRAGYGTAQDVQHWLVSNFPSKP